MENETCKYSICVVTDDGATTIYSNADSIEDAISDIDRFGDNFDSFEIKRNK